MCTATGCWESFLPARTRMARPDWPPFKTAGASPSCRSREPRALRKWCCRRSKLRPADLVLPLDRIAALLATLEAGESAELMPQPVKCLIVDDLEENLLALSALLERDDVQVLTARSGAEALELLLVHDVALAFLDVQMPEMDGFELAELMRGSERTRHIPLIFVTAGAREQQRLFKGYESGAVDFIYKPIEPRILQNKADVFFELYRQRQQLALELQDRSETLRLNEMFSALLAHDLRSPLSAILASAQLLQRRTEDRPAFETAARIVSSGKRMARMIEDMLDLARARLAGGIIVKRERRISRRWSSGSFANIRRRSRPGSSSRRTTATARDCGIRNGSRRSRRT